MEEGGTEGICGPTGDGTTLGTGRGMEERGAAEEAAGVGIAGFTAGSTTPEGNREEEGSEGAAIADDERAETDGAEADEDEAKTAMGAEPTTEEAVPGAEEEEARIAENRAEELENDAGGAVGGGGE